MLNVTVPAKADKITRSVETNVPATRSWLTSLPALDVFTNLNKIHAALHALNRTNLAPGHRLNLLEEYRDSVRLISHELRSRQRINAVPVPRRSKEVINQLRELHMEMANGYKIILVEMQNDKLGSYNRSQYAVATHRAIRYLTQVLLNAYECYAPVPNGTWLEIHELHAFARRQGIHREPVNDVYNTPEPKNTVEHAYKQALLIGLCAPYQLPLQMIHRVDQYLDKWARWARISRSSDDANTQCRFIVHGNDHPGIAASSNLQSAAAGQFLALDTRPLVRQVHLHLKARNLGVTSHDDGLDESLHNAHAKEMLRHLGIAWGVNPTRRFTRVDKDELFELAVGINATNYYLNGARKFELSAPESEREINIPVAGSFAYRALEGADDKFNIVSCDVTDEGATGLRLSIPEPNGLCMRVGDCVGFRPAGKTGAWMVGLIRWVRDQSPKRIEIGIQNLAPSAKPVALQPMVTDAQQTEDFKQGVLLPPIDILKQPQTLVAQQGTFHANRSLFVDTGNQLRMIRATRLVESTRSVERFEFEYLKS